MLSAAAGGVSRRPADGIGTAYRGSKRSELLTDTTVRGSTRVVVTAARGSADAVATASAGATTGGLIAAESRAGAGVGVETGAGAEVGVDVETDGDVDFDADADAGAGIGAEGAVVVGRAAISLGGAATLASGTPTVVPACRTTLVGCGVSDILSIAGPEEVAMVVTLRIGRATSGAGCAGFAIVGAGSVRSVVSGRTDPGLAAARTLSAAIGDEAARAVTSRASSIVAVGSRGERLYAERGPLFHTDP